MAARCSVSDRPSLLLVLIGLLVYKTTQPMCNIIFFESVLRLNLISRRIIDDCLAVCESKYFNTFADI